MGGNPSAPLNPDWDTWFLDQLEHDRPRRRSSSWATRGWRRSPARGGHEIRAWLVGTPPSAAPLAWTSYEPVPEWITGMGIGTTFDVALPS